MKKGVFYRNMVYNDNTATALRTNGYTEGGVGLVKESQGWVATHIPTGAKITPFDSRHSTARQALLEAENIISTAPDILKTIQKVMSHKGYQEFISDRRRDKERYNGS